VSDLVLVVEAGLLHEIGSFQGFTRHVEPYLEAFFREGNCKFIPRDMAENDASYKQLIPYVILKHGPAVFSYVRGKQGSEERLVAKRSIGIGGHIEPEDESLFMSASDMYQAAANREVDEEVQVACAYEEEIAALINDDSNEVGQVHLGIVHIWELAERTVQKREKQITQAGFMEIDELFSKEEELETWSRIAIRAVHEIYSGFE